jgi:hypothetical protein
VWKSCVSHLLCVKIMCFALAMCETPDFRTCYVWKSSVSHLQCVKIMSFAHNKCEKVSIGRTLLGWSVVSKKGIKTREWRGWIAKIPSQTLNKMMEDANMMRMMIVEWEVYCEKSKEMSFCWQWRWWWKNRGDDEGVDNGEMKKKGRKKGVLKMVIDERKKKCKKTR